MSRGGATGSLVGAGLGAALAPFTAGLSIPAGLSLGGSLGGAAGSLFGGGPKVKLPFEQANELLEFQGTLLPGLLSQQRQFAPGFAQADLDLTNQFGPQFATAQRQTQAAGNPERAAALAQLGQLLSSRGLDDVSLDPTALKALQQSTRSGQAARGVLRSPISALTEGLRTVEAGIQERDKLRNLAAALGGGLPVIGSAPLQGSQFVPNVSGLQSQANNIAFSRFAAENQQQGSQLNQLGTALGSLGGFFGSGSQNNGGVSGSEFRLNNLFGKQFPGERGSNLIQLSGGRTGVRL